jgi:hypothetical protein
MTITTANWPAAFRLAPFALGALLLSAECRADWKFKPSFDLSETYSDNVGLQQDALAQREWVSDAASGFTLSNNSRRLKLNASAEWHLFGYENKGLRTDGQALDPTVDPSVDPTLLGARRQANSTRAYRLQSTATVVDQLFYVDAQADRRRQPISAFGPLSANEFSNVNRSEISSWNISPYLQHRFGNKAALTVRFARDAVKGGGAAFGDSMASTRIVELNSVDGNRLAGSGTGLQSGLAGISGLSGFTGTAAGAGPGAAAAASGSRFGWTLSYSHQDLDTQSIEPGVRTGRTSSETATAGARWRVVPTVNLTADAGYDRYSYQAIQGGTNGKRWSLGAIWTPSSRTSLQASFGHRFFGKTGLLAFNHRSRNTTWTLDYNDEVTTTRSQFLLPASIDTAAMLDRMFASQFPDPVARQQAVQAYMAASGLPTSLAESINFLSNRYFRDRRLRGALVWRLSKTSVSLSVFRDQRTGLSVQQTDSLLLGSTLASLNDNTRQRGAAASLNYNLSSRTSAYAGFDVNHARSLSGGLDNDRRALSVGLSRRFGARTSGGIQVRRVVGTLALAGQRDYHENAVVANFTVKY